METTTTQTDRIGRRVIARSLGLNSVLPGIAIGTAHVLACARALPQDDATAIKWLAGYARLFDRTADSFAAELGLDAIGIREALTSPAMNAEARARFTGAVQVMREEFEAGLDRPYTERGNPFPKALPFHRAYGQLANTSVFRKVRSAVDFAEKENTMVRVLAKERIGKTVSAAHQFLRRLDTAAWVRVPSGDCMRTFLTRVSLALGSPSMSTGVPAHTLCSRIERLLGQGKIETMFLDQSHWLWPSDAKKGVPRRFEMVMDWWEQNAASMVLLTTPQDDAQAAAAAANHKHAHGQILGRVTTFACKETLSDSDIEAIVRLDGGDLDEACIGVLVEHCKAEPGYLGTLRLSIRRIAYRLANETPRPGESPDKFRTRVVASQLAKGAR